MSIIATDINESFVKFNFEKLADPMTAKKMLDSILAVYVDNFKFNPEFRSGVWDGKKRFYKIVDGEMYAPKGLIKSIIKFMSQHYNIEYTPTSYLNITRDELEDFIQSLNLPFKPYDFQFEYIYNSINEGRNVGISCTSSGKSLMIYIIMRWMVSQGMKSVLIVPNISLVAQMNDDFKSYGIDINVQRGSQYINTVNCLKILTALLLMKFIGLKVIHFRISCHQLQIPNTDLVLLAPYHDQLTKK